jgi:pimeloyl-ACP methyl ester carboxylesterase
VVIPECGHSAFWEQPEAFNQAVLDFIGKQR